MAASTLRDPIEALFTEAVGQCPCCGGADAEPFERLVFRGVPLRYLLCADCGLVYQSPRIPEAALPDFYATRYRQLYVGQAAPTEQQLAVEQARARHLLDLLPAGSAPRLHLDIGCGSGALLDLSRRQSGCRVVGIEPDDAQRAYAAGRGLPVFASLDGWIQSSGERPDLISMSHLLEHLNDPVAALKRLSADVLAPDGRLLIEVPNVYWHWALEIAHPLAFGPSTLRATLDRAGFEARTLVAHGVPRSRLPLYLSVVAERRAGEPKPLSRDRFPRQRRWLGIRLLGIERFGPTIAGRLKRKFRRK